MTTTSRAYAARSKLVALFAAAVAADVTVLNGPLPTSGRVPKRFVLVGTDGGDTGSGEGSQDTVTTTLVPSELSIPNARDETTTIVCAVWGWAGENSAIDGLRTDAQLLLDACASGVTADRTLGGLFAASDEGAYVSGVRATEQHTANGPYTRVAFDITYQARLLP